MLEILGLMALFMQDKDIYNIYYIYIKEIKNLEKEYKYIIKEIYNYYNKYQDKINISYEEFIIYYFNNNPSHKGREVYLNIFKSLKEIITENKINKDLLFDILKNILEKHYASNLAEDLLVVLEDGKLSVPFGELVNKTLKEFNDVYSKLESGTTDDPFVKESAADLFLADAAVQGFSWRLSFLNEYLGQLSGGVLGHIFARPDSGKTSFAVSEAAFFAEQLVTCGMDGDIIYFCNEEGAARVKRRSVNAVTKLSREQIMRAFAEHGEEFLHKLNKRYVERGGERIRFFDSARHITQIQTVMEHYRPKAVFIDQGPKVHCFGEDKANEVTRLRLIFGEFRELAKKYDCPIITLGQADNESEGKKWLSLNNLHNTKTDVQGELDFCIGVGRVYEAGEENRRFMSVVKNKLFNGLTGRGQVLFNRELSLYADEQLS